MLDITHRATPNPDIIGQHRVAGRAGAADANLIEQPMASAIGVGLPVHEPAGNMIVDIGGGTTEVAVMSMSGVVASRSLRVAGDEMDQDIVQYLRNKYNLLVGEGIAEQIKWKIGSAYPLQPEKTMEVRGRNLVTGLPETIEVSSVEIREALSGNLCRCTGYDSIVKSVLSAAEAAARNWKTECRT